MKANEPCERVLCAIAFATFPNLTNEAETKRLSELLYSLDECDSPAVIKFTAGFLAKRISFALAVRGDGVIYQFGNRRIWGILTDKRDSACCVLTPNENGVTGLKIATVRIREVYRYVSGC